MNYPNYVDLKHAIVRSCKSTKEFSMDFSVSFEKLKEMVEKQKLLPIKLNLDAKRVTPENIPYLSEYFEKSRLEWFSDNKFYTVLTFIDIESLDSKALRLLRRLNEPQVENPDNDKVKDMATLVAYYPCYFATVVSYQNDDPRKKGHPSYEIVCRANKIVIKNSNYQYNPGDFS